MLIDTYLEVVMKMHFVLLLLGMYLLPDGNTSDNHAIFGLCHDSLNSVKAI